MPQATDISELRNASADLVRDDSELEDALDVADKNSAALGETTELRGQRVLIVRPQEVVAAVQSLAQAYADYYAAVADYDRAQFRLYRALGHPAQAPYDLTPLTQAQQVRCPSWLVP